MLTEQYGFIINTLSGLIREAMNEQAREERYPSYSADEMDDKIKAARERAEDLKAVREQVERVEAGWRGQETRVRINSPMDFGIVVEREIAGGA